MILSHSTYSEEGQEMRKAFSRELNGKRLSMLKFRQIWTDSASIRCLLKLDQSELSDYTQTLQLIPSGVTLW